ncbi:MAG: type II toxin-antitoxin system RelE/ParE family toxin [Hydrococcus sp. C42_A2020_068]|uniref:type II toxin-antitoxin system RelE/ParE family toxin n=1 Tax=Pleurocapsa sp. PCC 7327 TaxID=118163 RepID=UPI00029FD206|nr:type II toxin-antitoxin system RelE/ParE family toxin [Pleurocapsa sp. PCC 7327]AFY77668.1 plasmid stabilization system protein [Pleurocapsa sp. PCC 7327]MBF2019095.1 type II toxin-antitoxin system RelE/ParE family toxin [Hydrococcus sp. C42_A2020_068]
MAYRVVWSSKAVEDVDAVATYIARDSPSYAAAVVKKIVDTTRDLIECPWAGSVVPEFSDPAILEKNAYTYRIIYRVKEEIVTIAAVIHTKRLLGLNG